MIKKINMFNFRCLNECIFSHYFKGSVFNAWDHGETRMVISGVAWQIWEKRSGERDSGVW